MSEDKFLGAAFFCIPRRLYVLVFAILTLAYGVVGVVRTLLQEALPGEAGAAAWQSQDRCIGHGCNDVLSCRGLREASFHFREVTSIFAGWLFGYWGVHGALHGYIDDLLYFAGFVFGCAVALVVIAAADGFYVLGCGEYPLNVVDEAILWSLPDVPVRDVVKTEIREAMVSYPVAFVNRLSRLNVYLVYLLVEAAGAAFFLYTAHQVMLLAQLTRHGVLGLGATYDLSTWRERMMLRNGLQNKDDYGAASAA
mmetsp:Transcript_131799/g.328669  ORF Transcript_131799/g.328669 Transcript_131799/m.328669 type:complete len:253 (-) Transcript_131799:34-792(-)